jgi:hypothetical protein
LPDYVPLESYVELNACDEAEAAGWFVEKVSWVRKRNAVDRLFIKAGRHVWIEFKRSGKKPRIGQLRDHERLRRAGAEVHWVDNLTDARRILGLPTPPGGPF